MSSSTINRDLGKEDIIVPRLRCLKLKREGCSDGEFGEITLVSIRGCLASLVLRIVELDDNCVFILGQKNGVLCLHCT